MKGEDLVKIIENVIASPYIYYSCPDCGYHLFGIPLVTGKTEAIFRSNFLKKELSCKYCGKSHTLERIKGRVVSIRKWKAVDEFPEHTKGWEIVIDVLGEHPDMPSDEWYES